MAYSAPSLSSSSQTFAQLQSRGFSGILDGVITANSLTAFQASLARSLFIAAQAQSTGARLREVVDNFISGCPTAISEFDTELVDIAKAFAAVLQAINEIGALVDANQGYLDNQYPLSGVAHSVRFWS